MNKDGLEQLICPDLLPILRYELSQGNQIERIDCPAGSECPNAVVLQKRMKIRGTEVEKALPESVVTWESTDPHYPKERGYSSSKYGHSIAGPF